MQLAMLFMGDGVSSPQPVFDLLAPGLKHRSARVKQHCLTILEQIISKCVFFCVCAATAHCHAATHPHVRMRRRRPLVFRSSAPLFRPQPKRLTHRVLQMCARAGTDQRP